MKTKAMTSTFLGILSIQNLLAAKAHALPAAFQPESQTQESITTQNPTMAERIIQKRLVGFDPKQAVETLNYLNNVGVRRFENDGSVQISEEMVQDVMEAAAIDGIEVRILSVENQKVKVKFAAHDQNKFDRSRIEEAKDLARVYQLKCDMDGKLMM